MLYVPGAGLTLSESLGLSSKVDRIGGFNINNQYMREQDTPFRRLEIINNLSRPPAIKYGDLQSMVGGDSGVLDNNPLNFDLRVDFFRQSEERVVVTFTVQTPNRELQFENEGGLETAKLNIFGRITAVSGKRSGIFEDAVTTYATQEELATMRDRKSVYQKAYTLTPGTYKVDVVVRDVATGNRGIINQGFTVPRYDDKSLDLDTRACLNTSTDRGTRHRGNVRIGNAKVIPNIEGVYKKGQDVGVYMQVYNAGIDQTTLRPAVDVEYVLTKNGKEVLRQPRTGKVFPIRDSG